ncbi:hypothetical protein C8J56DRAFT_981504 [Mycena floridula]|nr:hypothetical protein C8J56DRAFT_981504 [Mycena floridula]
MLFFRVTLAASLLLFSASAIPTPAGYYYDPVRNAPGQSYDPVWDVSSSNIDSRPPTYGAYAPSVPPLAPQLQPSTPKSPARASDSNSARSKKHNHSSGKAASKRQRSPNDGGSPSSQLPAKAIKGPKEVECDVCGLRLLQKNLNSHKKTHGSNAPKLKCTHSGCDSTFGRPSELNRHLSIQHGPAQRIKCPQCKYSTKWQDNLDDHIKTVHAGSSSKHSKK